jgi:hypothetical protein
MTPVAARFEIDRQLVERAAANGGHVPLVNDVRFVLYPIPRGGWCWACAELADGSADVEALFELSTLVRAGTAVAVGWFVIWVLKEWLVDVASALRDLHFAMMVAP